MKNNFDVIDYPLKIRENTKLIFHYNKYKIEFRIMDTLDSKKIYATKKRNTDLLLLLNIEDNNVNIIGHTTNLYEFEGPLDFYIDNTDFLAFKNKLGNVFIDGNITNLLDTSQITIEKFPPYYPPIINHYEMTPKILTITKNTILYKNKTESVRVYYNDKIPVSPLYNEEVDEDISHFINSLPCLILPFSVIKALFQEYKKSKKLNIAAEKIKTIISMFRYYVMDGPFRNCWVSFGYDPKIDKKNYKYQLIDLRSEGAFFHLFEKDLIIKEVEKNMDWYVKEDCDFKNGFFKKTLMQLILYHNHVKFENSSEEKEYFDILE
ncbi:transcription factor tau [Vairimorpha necatrix]|uniref:Transcription factor tau n=1 Tax=Vairimorpha necatrix TaxID=6039 RepID=A0AAX4JCF3_9MICR